MTATAPPGKVILHISSLSVTLERFVLPLVQPLEELGFQSALLAGDGPATHGSAFGRGLNLGRGVNALGSWRHARGNAQAIENIRPAAILIHTPSTALGLLPLLRRWKSRNIKLIYLSRGDFYGHPNALKRWAWSVYDPQQWSVWDVVAVVNPVQMTSPTGPGAPPRVLLPLGGAVPNVPPTDFEPPPIADWRSRGHLKLGWVGRFDADKHPEDFIKLVERLNLSYHLECRGVMMGGVLQGDRRRLPPVATSVDLEGWVAEPWRELASCDLLVSTSIREGFGMAPVEAASVGTPTFAYDTDGTRASVGAVGGTLVNRRDVDGMARLISEWAHQSLDELRAQRTEVRRLAMVELHRTDLAGTLAAVLRGAGL